jgi:hypothetical protein
VRLRCLFGEWLGFGVVVREGEKRGGKRSRRSISKLRQGGSGIAAGTESYLIRISADNLQHN